MTWIKPLAFGAAMTLAIAASLAAEEVPHNQSADYFMPGCRALLQNKGGDLPSLCAGIVGGIMYEEGVHEIGDEKSAIFCIPKEVTPDQAVRVVAAYIDGHPERMHERFQMLAVVALITAWPCNHQFPLKNIR
jgi:hypothetical protein